VLLNLLERMIDKLPVDNNATVLDLGVGTGVIASVLYNKGAQIYGVDFSEEILNKSKQILSNAILMQHDLSCGISDLKPDVKFD
jgi:putative AdoMet-dependent methyltransferase